MKQQDRNKAWGFTLFADDLRVEVAGKVSLMGLYQADMLFPSNLNFPISVSKFCMLVMYYEISGVITDDITFKVTLADLPEPLVEFNMPRKDLLEQVQVVQRPDLEALPDEQERIFHSRIPIALSPLNLPKAGRLRVRAHYSDGSILKLGSISVRQVELDEFNKMVGMAAIPPTK
ncbi:MAG: hypothetical protein ABSG88_16370 [Bradyrhizobium sp.]